MAHRRKRRGKIRAPQQQAVVPDNAPVDEPAPAPAQPAQTEFMTPPPQPGPDAPISIRYATVEDVQRIHFFLCLVSGPVLLAPINPTKAWLEIQRVIESDKEFALIAEINGELVGTLGIVAPDWWYSDERFMTDRWFFVYPQLAWKGVGMALLTEAAQTAYSVGLPLIINGKPVRKNKAGGSLYFMKHKLANPEPMQVH